MTEAKKEPTTVELFSTARRPLGWLGDDGNECHEAHADADKALADLERRTGAMERVLRAARMVCEDVNASSTVARIDAALTDAPLVFTLEELGRAAATYAAEMDEHAESHRANGSKVNECHYEGRAAGVRELVLRLTALRSTGGGR